MPTDIVPVDDHIVIEPIAPVTQSRGGILIPEVAQENDVMGVMRPKRKS